MKKIVLITSLALVAFCCHAQQGEINYTDFEPDLSIEEVTAYDSGDTLKIDLDQDGTIDFKMYIKSKYPTMVRYVYVTSSWDFRYCFNSIYSYGYMDENDSIIPNYPIWAKANSTWELLWYPDQYMEFIMGFRKTVDFENYYAWARIYMYRNLNGNGYQPGPGEFDIVSAYCDKMAFCTIPDYPLCWGQTSLTGVDEKEVNAFATVHPNPTNGLVSITGENLHQVEVLNVLGQQILSVQGKGDELHIDMAALPAGVYFVNVTDEEGRKCVRKVVKE